MKNSVLFIGNGINRLNGGGISWEELLIQIGSYNAQEKSVSLNEFKPLPLVLEEVVLSKSGNYNKELAFVKAFLSKTFNHLQPNEVHKKIIFDSEEK